MKKDKSYKKPYQKPCLYCEDISEPELLAGSGVDVDKDDSTEGNLSKQSNLFYFPYGNDDKNL